MMQFDVYQNVGKGSSVVPYLVDIQDNQLGHLRTTIVAPLLSKVDFSSHQRLTPLIPVQGASFYFSAPEIFAMERHRLGPVVANVEPFRHRIVAALDLLFTGV
jgi:hypothetical protein